MQELIPLNYARRLGQGTRRPLLIQLRHHTDKAKIYSKVSKLKGQTNQHGDYYFIADHLPEPMNEERRQFNDMVAENKRKPKQQQQQMSFKKGKLLIDNVQYEKAVTTPSPRELLFPSKDLLQMAEELRFFHGKDEYKENSKFIGYAVAVEQIEDVQAAYLQVKKKHAEATHVACAFRLMNKDSSHQDCTDDAEYGAGRSLLKLLKDENLDGIAIFMVRYYGGRNVGPLRFELFKMVTKSAIAKLMKAAAELKAKKEQMHLRDVQRSQDVTSTAIQPPDGWSTPNPWPNTEENTEHWDNTSQSSSDSGQSEECIQPDSDNENLA